MILNILMMNVMMISILIQRCDSQKVRKQGMTYGSCGEYVDNDLDDGEGDDSYDEDGDFHVWFLLLWPFLDALASLDFTLVSQ